MKFTKAFLAAVLACVLAFGLFACSPDDEKEQAARTPLEAAQTDPLAYLNALIPLLRDAERFVVETSYDLDDIKVGNDTLKEARNLVKENIKSYLGSSFTRERGGFFTTGEEILFGLIQKKGEPADMQAQCPALFQVLLESDLLAPSALGELMEGKIAASLAKLEEDIAKGLVDVLRDGNGISLKDENGEPVAAARASDAHKRIHVMGQLYEVLTPGGMLTQIKVNEVLELRVAEKLRQLEIDIERGLVSRLMDLDGKRQKDANGKLVKAGEATDEQKRVHVLNQLGENAVKEATGLYQIDGKLAFDVAEKLFTPVDKAEILAQLAKAEEYLLVEDFALEPLEFTLFVQANKLLIDQDGAEQPVLDPALAGDLIKELRLELKSALTATATGTGVFADAGEFPITLTLKKTVKYKDIRWKLVDEDA